MPRAWTHVRLFLADDEAVTAAEYAILLALVLMSVIIAIQGVGSVAESFWGRDGTQIGSALTGGS